MHTTVFTRIAVVLLSVTPAPLAITAYRLYGFSHLKPAPHVEDIPSFAAKMKPPRDLFLTTANGNEYLVWVGEDARPPVPSSGPACYVFDSSGSLVMWGCETGEGRPIDNFYYKRRNGQQITLEQALMWMEMETSAEKQNRPATWERPNVLRHATG